MDPTLVLNVSVNLFPTIVFCVVVWAMVMLQRRFLETVVFPIIKKKTGKDINKSLFYQEVSLPSGPIGTSVILALLLPGYPLPAIAAGAILGINVGRVFIGIFLGLFCGFIYRMVKKYFFVKVGDKLGLDPLDPSDVPATDPMPHQHEDK